jgi:ribosomal-protein-alanine N-acetyltransferase
MGGKQGLSAHSSVQETAMLETERLILRTWQPSDRDPFAQLNADPAVMRYFPATLSRAESDALVDNIESHHRVHGFGLWAVEEKATGSFTGFIGLNIPSFQAHFTPTVEIGWRLAQPFWGQGYATEGAKRVLAYGFTVLELPEILSFTATINRPSIAVMERLGMSHNAADDFDHPRLPPGHRLLRHVLYRMTPSQFAQGD